MFHHMDYLSFGFLPQVPSVSFSSGGRGSVVLLAFLNVVALAYRRVLQSSSLLPLHSRVNLRLARGNLCTPPLPFGGPTPHRNCLPETVPWPVGPGTRLEF